MEISVPASDRAVLAPTRMVIWVVILSALFNFTFGAMLPLIPRLSLETAGVAFTAFYIFKVICFAPAGIVSDRIGHSRGLTVAIAFQCCAILTLIAFPSNPWFGRIFEGIALAQGVVSAMSSLRVHAETPEAFQKYIKLMMTCSGVGFVFGPLTAYLLMGFSALFTLYVLAAVVFTAFMIHVLFFQDRKEAPVPETPIEAQAVTPSASTEKIRAFIWTGVGLAAAKAVAVGWQPTVAWWATDVIHLSPLLSGMTFLLMGISLAIGSAKPSRLFFLTGALGFLCMEIALRYPSPIWWAAMILTGYWWGSYLTFAFAKLGWDDPTKIGHHNSKWMLLCDIPTALVPTVIWMWRAPDAVGRTWLGAGLVAISILGYFYGFRPSKGSKRG